MSRVLLAVPAVAEQAADQAIAIVAESDDMDVAGRVGSANEIGHWLSDATEPVDVVLLHEDLGPIPVLELARDLNRRFPDTGLVLLAEDQGPELLRGAMFAGIRAVVTTPLSLEEFTNAVGAAAGWARSVRERFGKLASMEASGSGGSMFAVAGGKGGVGTTLVASSLALHLAVERSEQSVCLVDLDLQAGDVRAYFDITHARSITDMVSVARELTTRHLDESLYRHPSGLQVLLPPLEGELGEDVDTAAARQILGALRSRFDVVVVDVGATMNEATATAVEMADQVVVVTATNVPALRGANRLVTLWDRLAIRRDGIHALVNRVSRDNEVQPDLCARVLKAPTLRTRLASDFRALEPVVNTGRMTDRSPWHDSMAKLANELEEAIHESLVRADGDEAGLDQHQSRLRSRVAAGDTGQSATEFLAILPLVAVALLVAWQLVVAGWAFVQTQEASRHAARQYGVSQGADGDGDGVYDDVAAAARQRLPGDWKGDAVVRQFGDNVSVSVPVPSILPFMDHLGSVSSTSGGVRE